MQDVVTIVDHHRKNSHSTTRYVRLWGESDGITNSLCFCCRRECATLLIQLNSSVQVSECDEGYDVKAVVFILFSTTPPLSNCPLFQFKLLPLNKL